MRIYPDAVLRLAQVASVGIIPCLIRCCRYHGGKSTGAKNPVVKHGYYTKVAIERRKSLKDFMDGVNEILEVMT